MAFIESPRFPEKISYGSSGGPNFSTDVVTVDSGYETRIVKWSQARHSYDAAFGVMTEDLLSDLISFFQAMMGKANSFRYKDFGDYKSCKLKQTPSSNDQLIGEGDSTNGSDGTSTFQLIKNYSAGLVTVRNILKPVQGTVLIEVNGTLKTEGVHYNLDYTTGVITFTSGNIPLLDRGDGNPEEIKSGYEFDVPCRFDTDELNINFDAYSVGSTSVPIIEVRI